MDHLEVAAGEENEYLQKRELFERMRKGEAAGAVARQSYGGMKRKMGHGGRGGDSGDSGAASKIKTFQAFLKYPPI